MPLNFKEFLAAVEADASALKDAAALKDGSAPPGVTICADCNIPLQESVTGHRERGDGSHVCSDCYFEAFGDELDRHPVRGARIIRGA